MAKRGAWVLLGTVFFALGGCGGKEETIDLTIPTVQRRGAISESLQQLRKIFLQDAETPLKFKQRLWEEKYRGYQVEWEGVVLQASQRVIKLSEEISALEPLVTIRYDPGDPPPPKGIEQYDRVKFRGLLESFHPRLGFTIVKSQIIAIQKRRK